MEFMGAGVLRAGAVQQRNNKLVQVREMMRYKGRGCCEERVFRAGVRGAGALHQCARSRPQPSLISKQRQPLIHPLPLPPTIARLPAGGGGAADGGGAAADCAAD